MIGLNRSSLLAVIFISSVVACSSAQTFSSVNQVKLELAVIDQDLKVTVRNVGTEGVVLYNALGWSLLPDDPGLEFVLKDSTGKLEQLCAFVEPSGDRTPVTLAAGKSINARIGIGFLASTYCLAPGEYSARAILYTRDEHESGRLIKIDSPAVRMFVVDRPL